MNAVSLEEGEIIRRVQEGEVDVYSNLIDMHASRLRAFVALNSPSPQLIHEIAHDTFVYAFLHIGEFEKGSFFSWLKAIAWNLLRAEMQRFSREQFNRSRYSELHFQQLNAVALPANERRELEFLERCLRQLDGRMLEILEAKYIQAFSAQEIAKRLQRTEAQVKSILFRLRKQLQKCVETQTKLHWND